MKNYLRFSKGNKKLNKDTLIFDLPAGKTCPGANECHSFVTVKDGKRTIKDGANCKFRCYAASQEALFSAVYEKRKYNLELIQNTLNSESMREMFDNSVKIANGNDEAKEKQI